MKYLTPNTMAAACGGIFYGDPKIADMEICDVITDSRRIVKDCLFVPLVGERFDGHDFIDPVMEAGAMLVLTRKPETKDKYPCILVDDTKEALGRIAHYYLSRIGAKVVSVTGSVGKTSTKETIAAVLSTTYRTRKTPGNFNNDIGLPLTIFTLEEGDEMAVLEMGINHFGEMDALGRIANPDIAVITNIGECHLEFLQDRDGVFRAKTEIFSHLKPGADVILNGDDDKLRAVRSVNGVSPVFYGIDSPCAVYATDIRPFGMDAIECVIHVGAAEAFPVRIPYPGTHMVMNALAAAAVGTAAGVTPENIRRGIESLVLPDGRFHRIETRYGFTVIDDCYNANPVSMKASLSVLAGAEGRRCAILGDMGELGEGEEEFHREVGAAAAEAGPELVIMVGPKCRAMYEAYQEKAPGSEALWFPDTASAIPEIRKYLRAGDTVLVKASHSMGFDKIVADLI